MPKSLARISRNCRSLCTAADDKASLAIAMNGVVSEHMIHGPPWVRGLGMVSEQTGQ